MTSRRLRVRVGSVNAQRKCHLADSCRWRSRATLLDSGGGGGTFPVALRQTEWGGSGWRVLAAFDLQLDPAPRAAAPARLLPLGAEETLSFSTSAEPRRSRAPFGKQKPSPAVRGVSASTTQRDTERHGSARHGSARLGTARHGSARHGSARLGTARHGTARLDSARLNTARLGSTRLGSVRHGSARLGTARLDTARHGTARRGTARHGSTRHGSTRPGSARHGSARFGTARARLGTARLGSTRLGTARHGPPGSSPHFRLRVLCVKIVRGVRVYVCVSGPNSWTRGDGDESQAGRPPNTRPTHIYTPFTHRRAERTRIYTARADGAWRGGGRGRQFSSVQFSSCIFLSNIIISVICTGVGAKIPSGT